MRKYLLTALASTIVVTALAAHAETAEPNYLVVKDLRVLVVVYRGQTNAPPKERIDDNELEKLKNAMECSRLFYFRNTDGQLNITPSYKLIDTVAPDHEGPTYDNIVEDLRKRGYVDNQYDGIFTTGIGMVGNWGGFTIFDKTGAALGTCGTGGQLRQFPSGDTNVAFDAAWIFVHEFQHALDLSIAGGAGFSEFVHGHPFTDSSEHPDRTIENPGGQHWDWEACTLRNFKHYLQIPGATSSEIYALDSDDDGLADYHPVLPMDEKRFGTDPAKPDTDGDGLSDLDEFTADVYLGSNPQNPDSDGDGVRDDMDEWPTVAINSNVSYAWPKPEIDGKLDTAYAPLICRAYATDWETLSNDAAKTWACWDEETLYIFARAPASFTLEVQTDTSADNSFWIGGDTYVWHVKADSKPALEVPKIPEWPGAQAVWTTDTAGNTVVEMALPTVVGERGITSGEEFPEDDADGLELLDGRLVSFNIAFDFPEKKKRILLTPTWTMVSTTLRKKPDDPDLPILRFTAPMQNTDTPTVRVDGVAPETTIKIVDEAGKTLGTGKGCGEIQITNVKAGHDPASGKNIIVATTSTGKRSKPFALVIDTSSKPPALAATGTNQLAVAGEPEANTVIEYQTMAGKWVPITSAVLDKEGRAVVEIDPVFKGFRGEYFNTEKWTEPVMYRIDREIKFDYEDGTPAEDIIDRDTFSVRWTGYIEVFKKTKATFFLTTDDGGRLYVDDKLVVDNWGTHSKKEKSGEVTLSPGVHVVRIEYYEDLGWAAAHLEWQPEGGERTYEIPVRAFQSVPAEKRFRATQTDVLGNESEPSATLTVR